MASKESPNDESSSQMEFTFSADQEETSVVPISDEEGSDQGAPSASTSKSASTSCRKWCLEDQALESSAPKKPATVERSTPPWESSLPSRVREEHLHPVR